MIRLFFSKGKLSEYFSIFRGAAVKFALRESTPSAGSYAKRLFHSGTGLLRLALFGMEMGRLLQSKHTAAAGP